MHVRWKGKHPSGGQITHLELTTEEAAALPLPKHAELGLDIFASVDHPELAKAMNVKTKWFAITIS